MLTAKSGLTDWEWKLTKSWFNFQHLRIISWHNAFRAVLTGMTIATDPTILLSVQNSAMNQCCLEESMVVRVQLALDFQDLNTIRPHPPWRILYSTPSIKRPTYQWAEQSLHLGNLYQPGQPSHIISGHGLERHSYRPSSYWPLQPYCTCFKVERMPY